MFRCFNQAHDSTKTGKQQFVDDVKKMCEENFVNDAIIEIGYSTFFASKKILSSYSSYFKNVFEKNPNKTLISLEDIDEDIMRAILFYFYTKRIILDCYNIEKILAASKILQIAELELMCLEKLDFPDPDEYEDESDEEIDVEYEEKKSEAECWTIVFMLIVMLVFVVFFCENKD